MTPLPRRSLTTTDHWLAAIDQGLRTVWGKPHASRRPPATPHQPDAAAPPSELSEDDRRLAGGLMRVNHVGEVCAQALYSAQALATQDPALRQHFEAAAQEEADHLAWTGERLTALGARPSWLNPLWYAGSFAIGYAAGRLGPQRSLGFVIETERQVERHLQGHLDRLPAADVQSRAVVAAMAAEEARHADDAQSAGGVAPPAPVRWLMRSAAKVMTSTARHI
jgi:3-demethoxyubiquinol 3-hydroxylase